MTIFTWLLFGLVIKHAWADLFLQSMRPPAFKVKYLNGFKHYLDHGIWTALIVMLCFGLDEWMAALIFGIFDLFIHSLIDYSKANLLAKLKWTQDQPRYWKLQSLDQMLHFGTYMIIVITASNYFGAI